MSQKLVNFNLVREMSWGSNREDGYKYLIVQWQDGQHETMAESERVTDLYTRWEVWQRAQGWIK